ncbi:hypothetical protein SEUCBS140593_000465 [Sporothrix eucalyptigena]|uniref:M protein repeat protein n=1 Tax=Sporothrix eucalyptigena TaxID=1812306 RepID=A0ABP0AQ25_9PEZI
MADEDKAKAEKLAAAKKRVEALKKKKQTGGAASTTGKKGGKKDKTKEVEDEPAEDQAADDDKEEAEEETKEEAKEEPAESTEKADKADSGAGKSDKKKKNKKGKKDGKEEKEDKDEKDDKPEEKEEAKDKEDDEDDIAVTSPTSPKATAPSLSEQSRLRSASFRLGGPIPSGPLSPSADGETAADIYRKQLARIDELEKQNKRLTKDAADAEKRWQKAEDDLADARDGASADSPELAKLKSEIAALTRQNTQLQARSNTRHGSSPSMSIGSPPTSELETQLKSKSQTIETMELEMSRLRAQVERLSVKGRADGEEGDEGAGSSGHGRQEQVAALEEKLERAEKAAGSAQRELAELKRNLDRTSEKAVREGSARTSAETKLKTLEKESQDLRTERDELTRKVEGLEKKVTTLTTLHKEHDARSQALRRDKERAEHDLAEVRTRLEKAEAENLRLRKSDARDGGGTDDEHLDELLASSPEASERIEQLDRRVRELEAENTDLRHGIWQERRKELQVGPDGETPSGGGRHFSDVDLSPLADRGAGGHKQKGHTGSVSGGGALGDFFSVLTGSGSNDHSHHGHGHGHGHDDDGFLDDDEDMDFDEEAFRRAQEEEARQRLERVREAKRALKNWEGWRLDLVESRQGGAEGIGPIFEI